MLKIKAILSAIGRFARTRGQQTSTWRGVVLLCSAAGYVINPDAGEAIIAAGLSISGLLAVLLDDTLPPSSTPQP